MIDRALRGIALPVERIRANIAMAFKLSIWSTPQRLVATRLRVERQVTKCLKCQKYMSEDISDIMATTHAADECQHKMTQRCVDYITKRAALLPFEIGRDELGLLIRPLPTRVAVECWRKSDDIIFLRPAISESTRFV